MAGFCTRPPVISGYISAALLVVHDRLSAVSVWLWFICPSTHRVKQDPPTRVVATHEHGAYGLGEIKQGHCRIHEENCQSSIEKTRALGNRTRTRTRSSLQRSGSRSLQEESTISSNPTPLSPRAQFVSLEATSFSGSGSFENSTSTITVFGEQGLHQETPEHAT
ncbi:hypothetical protein FIBSPDRAFT_996519 [Athelia psychrophila]|uniref:Uncharacterized protein n=1 Tax=Athelia psychrophila TaxID=1759441 RepID=A0A165WV57_9AGAM|nr:hypothetical protein FIBSPDRAFT_996519 [Fibularhizoctonia sp. CBS 109695]